MKFSRTLLVGAPVYAGARQALPADYGRQVGSLIPHIGSAISQARNSTSRMSMKEFLKNQARKGQGAEFYEGCENLIKIPWVHASKKNWRETRHCKIFMEWATYTGRPSRDPKKCKANFRCALNSLSDVTEREELSRKNGSEGFRVFQLRTEKKPSSRRKRAQKMKETTPTSKVQQSAPVINPSIFESPPTTPNDSQAHECLAVDLSFFGMDGWADFELDACCEEIAIDGLEVLPPPERQTSEVLIPLTVKAMEVDDDDDDDDGGGGDWSDDYVPRSSMAKAKSKARRCRAR